MKALLGIFLGVGLCVAITIAVTSKNQLHRSQAELARAQTEWAAEKHKLEEALKKARARPHAVEMPAPAPLAPVAPIVVSAARPDPREIIERLQGFKFAAAVQGQGQPPVQSRQVRRLLHEFEILVDAGPTALPAIREFLARNLDLDYQPGAIKGPRDGSVQTDFLVPPSLRLGLFDALRQMGGSQAEAALADVLKSTARGVEVAYLARVLQEMAPNKYRDTAVATVKELLANPVIEAAALDKNDRSYLFGVLQFFNDASYAGIAQGQLLAANGQVDRAALTYLHKSLGEQAVPIVANAFQDPRLTDAASKEPLARVALAFVGTNPQAEQMFGKAVRDPALAGDPIRNLVEDLNQDGFANRRVTTPEDVKLANFRFALTEQYLQQPFVQSDKTLSRAFTEANKDLAGMLQRASGAAPPLKVKGGNNQGNNP